MFDRENAVKSEADVVLIGAGIMSATLGTFIKELQPDWTIEVFERLDEVSGESSDAWNNAGTGHSALCELNYTPERPDGSIDISKALKVNEQFQVSRQFWSYLVSKQCVPVPGTFINSIPHMSLVFGEKNAKFLKKRQETMTQNHLFDGMVYSDDRAQLEEWMPLIMEGRDPKVKMAATYTEMGTDVNFGSLTRSLFKYLGEGNNVNINYKHEVDGLHQSKKGYWYVNVIDENTKQSKTIKTNFVFIGAGGAALPLLEKSGIPEGKGYGGFPVSGLWLKCNNVEVIEKHHAKVYGKPESGTPPMSQPHLDARVIDGEKEMLFGPFAGFSTKFLKEGSLMDLPSSITLTNVLPMIDAGIHNLSLTKYLIDQLRLSPEERFEELLKFVPTAKIEDWELKTAGQRVQVIKKEDGHGVLEFGTEVVTEADGSLAALLGASPGASTSVAIMLNVLEKCFKEKVASEDWQKRLKQMIPSYGYSLADNKELALQVRQMTKEALHLKG